MINSAGIQLIDDSLIRLSNFNRVARVKSDHNRLYQEVKSLYDEMQEINAYLFNSDSAYWFQEYKKAYMANDSKKKLDNYLRMSLRYIAEQLTLIKIENA